jgi:anti-sigma B factor antagonist
MLVTNIEPFSCEVTSDDGRVVVAPRGELDMATVGAVEAALRRVRERGEEKVMLDLRGLSFLDSSGIHLAVKWAQQAEDEGFEFKLTPGPPVVQRVFELSALDDRLPFERDGTG